MRAIYPSDITREQFSVIEYDLHSARKVTHPRTYDLYVFLRGSVRSQRRLYLTRLTARFSPVEHRIPLLPNMERDGKKRRSLIV
jgi:hypothetical protein